ncbi:hypothetical protein DL93DRAFT_2149666 [Clavulina sp. PMI_390]|nr:hypothetical protein DL93DRAFT_2149666 [Clavulina sp. PMI_390]
MPVLSLPLTFSNSFWSQDYRRGLEAIHGKLVQGVEEDVEVVEFIRARARCEREMAQSLINPRPTGSKEHGMDRDDGASLLAAFRGLQAESAKQGEAHLAIANELENLVADPFEAWAKQHATRISEAKSLLLNGFLRTYEEGVVDVTKLKDSYLTKARKADEAEDDARYAPNSELRDGYTTPPNGNQPRSPRRGGSVSDRIASQFFGRTASPERGEPPLGSPPIVVFEPDALSDAGSVLSDGSNPTKVDKGKGKELPPLVVEPSQPAPESINLAGVPFPVKTIPELLTRAKAEMPLRPVRIPLLGEYEDTFTGEDFVIWLKNNVPGFMNSLDFAETAARELTEREGLLRRVGEFGNKFENHPAANFQFRPKAFEIILPPPPSEMDEPVMSTPTSPTEASFLKRSNTVASYLAKSLRSSAAAANEPPHRKARIAADEANEKYRTAVRKLDRQRLSLEDRIETALKQWHRWELDRLRAVKTVLLQYQGTISNFPKSIAASLENSSTLLTAFQPELDLIIAIERYRTGPFRPKPHLYESIRHEKMDVIFGIDLREWAGEGGWHAVRATGSISEPLREDAIPWVVRGLLAGMDEGYKRLPNDIERRKSWIYDVPLAQQHALREALNTLPMDRPVPQDMLAKQDPPVIASTLKLWLLELDPSLATWEAWEEVKKLYPAVGADSSKDADIVDDLKTTLRRLPKVHLLVLDAIVKHLVDLIEATPEGTEPKEVYVTKLALSMGRSILRPQHETQVSIQERHPTTFFIDLINNYALVLPAAITEKKRESLNATRAMPVRKRTAPIDMRVNRSRLSQNIDPHELLAVQKEMATGQSLHRAVSPSPGDRTPRRLSFAQQPPAETPNTNGNTAALLPPAPPSPAQAPAPVPEVPSPTTISPASISPRQAPSSITPTADNGFPKPPTFLPPPPETDDDADFSMNAMSGVIVVPPPSSEQSTAAPSQPAPPPERTPTQSTFTPPPPPPPLMNDAPPPSVLANPPPPPPPMAASPPSESPNGGRRSITPTGSGRRTPTGNSPSGAARSRSPPARKSSIESANSLSRTPSVSSSLRHETGRISGLGSIGGEAKAFRPSGSSSLVEILKQMTR